MCCESRARLIKELQHRAEALAGADVRKDEFLAMLAHELRNPLAPLTNALHVFRQFAGDALVLNRAREVIERQVRYMARLLGDLLDVSRITRGKVELRKEPIQRSKLDEIALKTSLPLLEIA